jgi:hypothetical protein
MAKNYTNKANRAAKKVEHELGRVADLIGDAQYFLKRARQDATGGNYGMIDAYGWQFEAIGDNFKTIHL